MGIEAFLGIAWDVCTRGYDAYVGRGAPFVNEEYIRLYLRHVRESIDLVPDVKELDDDALDEGITALLQSLTFIVRAYHGNDDGVAINANYMIPLAPSPALVATAMFTRRDRREDAFACFLRLVAWAQPDNVPDLVVLPVERGQGGDPLLFGAPRAFVEKTAQVMNDTDDTWQEQTREMHVSVRADVGRFFEEQRPRFRSFASLPVFAPPSIRHSCPHPVLAVVNIDSSRTYVLGKNRANQAKLRLVLEPITHVLSYFLVRRHFRIPED